MADNVVTNPGVGGDTIGADDIGGAKYQRIKVIVGDDGVNDGDVSATNPMPVEDATNQTDALTDTELRATPVPVSGTVTANLSTTDNTVLDNIDTSTAAAATSLGAIDNAVDGNYLNANINIAGVDVDGNSGNKSAQTVRVVLATDQPALTNKLLVTPDLPTGASTLAEQQTQTASLSVLDDWDNAASDGASVSGDTAHDAADAGEPVKVGFKAITASPTGVAANDRVNGIADIFGRQAVMDYSPELNTSNALTNLRDLQVAQRYTLIGDSFAAVVNSFWSQSAANGGTVTSTGGEGLLDTSANATGSIQVVSPVIKYLPGQSTWFNSAFRLPDTGSANNIRRWGVFTVSGTTPQDGFYFELNGTTLNAVSATAGTPTAVAVGSWTRVTDAPFTLDTNAHSWEIRFTSYGAQFYVDNVVRHTIPLGSSAPTSTLDLSIIIQNINSSGATSRKIYVRNIGMGRFGTEPVVRDFNGSPPRFASVAASSSGNNTIVSAITGVKIRVLSAQLVANGAVNGKWQSGAGGTDLTGLAYLAANGGYVLPFNPNGWFETAAGSLLNLNLSGAVAVGGSIQYIEV